MRKQNTVSVKVHESIQLENKKADISGIIVIGDNVIVADRNAGQVIMFGTDLRMLERIHFSYLLSRFFWGIADIAAIESDTFAVLLPGNFFESKVVFFKVHESSIHQSLKTTLRLDSRCFGICFRRNHLFATFSPVWKNCYVKMYDKEDGSTKKIFQPEELLGHRGLSKVHVDDEFRIFLNDENRKQLLVFKKDTFKDEVQFEASYDYAAKGMAASKEGIFFATSSLDGVIKMHHGGKWINNNFLREATLGGKSVAVAVKESNQERIVYVAISKSNIFGFKRSYRIDSYKLEATDSTECIVQLN